MSNTVQNSRMRKLDPDKCTLTLKLDIRELRVRMAIGVWLIKLGARVIGLGVKVEALPNVTGPLIYKINEDGTRTLTNPPDQET